MKNLRIPSTLLGLLLLAAGSLSGQGTHPIGSICKEGTETPPIELTWKQLPEAGSVVRLGSPLMQLVIANNTRAGLRVRVLVAGALDEVRETLEVGEAIVQPGATSTLTVDLSRFKHDLGTLRFSGRMVAKGFARPTSGGLVSDLAYSPYAYFHEQAGRLVAYRSDALAEQFHAGDFAGHGQRLRYWAAGRGLRLGGIGTLGKGLNLTDDDGGPQEGTNP